LTRAVTESIVLLRRGRRTSESAGIDLVARPTRTLKATQCCKVFTAKMLRAYGGCLGGRSRGRTRQAAKSSG